MRAVIVAIGDELTSGQRVDTNSAWLSDQLADLGVAVAFHATAGDDLDDIAEALRWAVQRVELVIITGGLGPTADDLTRDAIALTTGCELVLDAASRDTIRTMFAARGRAMPEQNERQAFFPRGSRIIPNPHGTAPGIDWSPATGQKAARIIALPGVPAEMREMWHQTVRPALLSEMAAPFVIRHRQIHCFGLGESEVERRLPDLIRRGREPRVGITAHRATISLRVTARGPDEAACWSAMQPTVDSIYACLGDYVFGEDDLELPEAVLRLLERRGQTLATAEQATLGCLAHGLHAADGGRGRYRSGLVLGVDASPPAGPEGVRNRCRGLAHELLRTWGCDFALVVGAVQMPGSPGEPPWVPLQLCGPDCDVTETSIFAGHPDILVERCAKSALNLLRRHLLTPTR